MKIIVTGFSPYGGEAVNPSQEVLKLLPDEIMNVKIIKYELQPVYHVCLKIAMELVETHEPIAFLSLGMAQGKSHLTVERVGLNLIDSPKTDNAGVHYLDTLIKEDGPDAYFTHFPVKESVKSMVQNGIPANVSYCAGTFISNHLIYGMLYLIHKKGLSLQYGHIGLPFLPGQTVDRPHIASMSARDSAKGVTLALEALITQLHKTN